MVKVGIREAFRDTGPGRWGPWHFGLGNASNVSAAPASDRRTQGVGDGAAGAPNFVPARWRDPLVRASSKWNVPVELLAAQLYAKSNFNPFAVSRAGAKGL